MRFVGHLSDRQFIRLDNFHVPRMLDTRRSAPATAATCAEVFTCAPVCRCAYCTWCPITTCHDFARVLHACISAQTSLSVSLFLSLAWYTSSERDLSQERGRERKGDRLMCSENLLPTSQYYNYFISGSLIMLLFMGEQWWLRLFFPILFLLFLSSFLTLLALPRNDTAFHKSVRFVGERILGIRMTNRASVRKRVRLIVRCVPRRYLLYKLF